MIEPPRAVFLSYAAQDVEAARRICAALRSAGIEVWFDQHELRGGDAWDQKIRRQIRDCALFIPIISAHTQARPEGYFRLEWKLAVDRSHLMATEKAFLIPAVVDATTEPEALVPAQFRDVQWTDMRTGEVPPTFAERIATLLSQPVAFHSGSAALEVSRKPARRFPLVSAVISVAVMAALALATAMRGEWLPRKPAPRVDSAATLPPVTTTPSAIPEKSVAVLPFVDMSEKHDQEYFSDGLSDELINELVKIPDLRVPARTSSFYFKGKQTPIAEVGKVLGVAHVLEGSVRKAGGRIRVTTQLIRVSDGYNVWSRTDDGLDRDVFRLQDDIARAVAEALQATLSSPGTDLRGTAHPDAYNLLLQANYWAERSNPENLIRSVEFAKQAVAIDPSYADAWARLAINYLAMSGSIMSVPDARKLARDAANRAIASAPDRGAGHNALAYVLVDMGDFSGARREIEAQKRGKRTPGSYSGSESFLELALGHWQRSIEINTVLEREDPLSPILVGRLGDGYYGTGRFAEAEASYRRQLALAPDGAEIHASIALAALAQGRNTAALVEASREKDESARLVASAVALLRVGRKTEADAALSQLIGTYGESNPVTVAESLAVRGERDAAFEWLDRARKSDDSAIFQIKGDLWLIPLHDDARWSRLVRELNLPE